MYTFFALIIIVGVNWGRGFAKKFRRTLKVLNIPFKSYTSLFSNDHILKFVIKCLKSKIRRTKYKIT